ncbi:MAG: type 4a pilus biogenesis protein PilO [Candidatus Marinimicrobia bacterium]|nr:type 4a pilus biogenesis protein PilO [Candidatus Neomarinimicrobiota bacterium]
MKKINYRQKLLIAFVLVIILAGAWFVMIYAPQKQKVANLDSEIGKLKRQIRTSGNTVTSLPRLQKRIETMNVEFDSLAVLIPTKDSIAIITDEIVSLCLKNNLKMDHIQPSLDALLVSNDYFVKVPIEIQVMGSFLDIGHFVDDLIVLPFNYYQTDFNIERNADELELTIGIESYIYVINPKGKI